MADAPNPNDDAKLVSQVDQFQAVIAGTGDTFGEMHARLIARGVPEYVAGKIVEDAAHQWFAGTFNKRAGIQLPGMP